MPSLPELGTGRLIPAAALKKRLAACGVRVKIFRGCRLVLPERISIGDHSQIDEGVFLAGGMGIRVGAYVHLAIGCSITGGGQCEIGDFGSIGLGVRILTGTELMDGLTNPTVPPELRTVERSRVVIGRHCIVFTGAIVLPGVTIGEGAVISAAAVVHHDLKPWGVYAGNPLVQVGLRPKENILRLRLSRGHSETRRATSW